LTYLDDREWDALISVRKNSVEETFVVSKLSPKLETEMGFKISIHNNDIELDKGKYDSDLEWCCNKGDIYR